MFFKKQKSLCHATVIEWTCVPHIMSAIHASSDQDTVCLTTQESLDQSHKYFDALLAGPQ